MNIITENQIHFRRNILMNLLGELGYASIRDFQARNGLAVDGMFGRISYGVLYKLLLNVVELSNFEGHFWAVEYPKKQIVWHHSAGWDNARGMFDWWVMDGARHVATAIGITDDGTVFRGYDERFWAHHIGMRNWQNLARNQQSVAVEICNWGCLTKKNNKFYSWADAEIHQSKVIELDFKGFKYYEAYTDAEIKSLKYWTLLNAMRFSIEVTYSESNMWQVSQDAINGVPGIYTHNSFPVAGKTDVSPQPKLIEMAKSLIHYQK